MNQLFLAGIYAVLCDNFVFRNLFGIDTAADEEHRLRDVFLRTLLTSLCIIPASVLSFELTGVLENRGIGYLSVLVFPILLALLEIGADILLSRSVKTSSLTAGKVKIFLNSAVFAAILTSAECASASESLYCGVLCAIGLLFGSMLLCGIRERLETADIPESFRGLPVLIAAAGICAMIFTGFSGLNV